MVKKNELPKRCGVLKKVDSRTGTNHTYMSHPLSHSDLLRIIEEYLTSELTKYATEKKYGLYQGCITYWLRTFGLDDKPKNDDIMVEQPTTSTPETTLSPSEKDELQNLRREIRELKVQLKREELGHKAYKLLVEIAEETYDIDIRKNIGAK